MGVMESQISFFLDSKEWLQLTNELEFLLCKVYGEDLKRRFPEIRMQIPHVLAFMLEMMRFSCNSGEPKVVKLAREEM